MDVAELSMFLESLEPGATVSPEEFERAAETVKHMKGLDNDQRLQLYGLYKQSTVGNINISKPYFFDAVGAAKWWVLVDIMSFPNERPGKVRSKTFFRKISGMLGRHMKASRRKMQL
jgi:acyl-CoA-binding protein